MQWEPLTWDLVMLSDMVNDVFKTFLESSKEEEKNEKDKGALRNRCKNCSDAPYCDMDYCLHWYH